MPKFTINPLMDLIRRKDVKKPSDDTDTRKRIKKIASFADTGSDRPELPQHAELTDEIHPESPLRARAIQIITQGEMSGITADAPAELQNCLVTGCDRKADVVIRLNPTTLVTEKGLKTDVSSDSAIQNAVLAEEQKRAVLSYRRIIAICLNCAFPDKSDSYGDDE